jgi:hypothetical protein
VERAYRGPERRGRSREATRLAMIRAHVDVGWSDALEGRSRRANRAVERVGRSARFKRGMRALARPVVATFREDVGRDRRAE